MAVGRRQEGDQREGKEEASRGSLRETLEGGRPPGSTRCPHREYRLPPGRSREFRFSFCSFSSSGVGVPPFPCEDAPFGCLPRLTWGGRHREGTWDLLVCACRLSCTGTSLKGGFFWLTVTFVWYHVLHTLSFGSGVLRVWRVCDLGQVAGCLLSPCSLTRERRWGQLVTSRTAVVSMWVCLGEQVGTSLKPTAVSEWGSLPPQLE